mgnify:CR=1 FL=1
MPLVFQVFPGVENLYSRVEHQDISNGQLYLFIYVFNVSVGLYSNINSDMNNDKNQHRTTKAT